MPRYDANYWLDELDRYKQAFAKFDERGKNITKRYRDERKDAENIDARFNILWSNIKTLKPALYSRVPKVEVSRRHKDQDDISRVAAMMAERAIAYELQAHNDYHDSLSQCVDDRLLAGRGVAWLRYEPEIETVDAEPQITEDVEEGGGEYSGKLEGQEQGEPYEQIVNERTIVDYVYWRDFAHHPARTWEECTWVARRVFIGRDEGNDRFGSKFDAVPLTDSPDSEKEEKSSTYMMKKAEVWEIWCKTSDKVYWVARGCDSLLDEREDPLELTGFFPCPKPLYATMTNDSLIPVADFVLYQDQASELDEITGRIKHLTKAMKAMGVYAADEPALARLLKEGNDAVMIPVTNWAMFAEKGGLQNAVQFMPLRDVAGALQQLYQARDSVKQIIYEVTGLSDIIRGASVASETATAQQIKSQYASLRLGEMKDDVARFAREILRLKGEIIFAKYQPEMLVRMSGMQNTPDAQLIPQALQLLQNEPLRMFAIDIESDTLVELDEQQDKQARMEFLTAAGGFLEKAMQVGGQAPELAPLLMQMMLFGLRGFKVGRELEGTFEQVAEQVKQKSAQPPQPQPNPEMIKAQQAQAQEQAKAQAEMQKAQMGLQLEQAKMQQEGQIEQQRQQLEIAKAQNESQLAQQKQAFDEWKAKLDADTKLAVAQLQADNAMRIKAMDKSSDMMEMSEDGTSRPTSALHTLLEQSNANMMQLLQAHSTSQAEMMQAMAQHLSRPKQVMRDQSGKIIGVQ